MKYIYYDSNEEFSLYKQKVTIWTVSNNFKINDAAINSINVTLCCPVHVVL